jgi:hypothetical protein
MCACTDIVFKASIAQMLHSANFKYTICTSIVQAQQAFALSSSFGDEHELQSILLNQGARIQPCPGVPTYRCTYRRSQIHLAGRPPIPAQHCRTQPVHCYSHAESPAAASASARGSTLV